MTLDAWFALAGTAVLPAWVALAAAPYRWQAPRYVAVTVAAAIAMLYAALIGAFFADAPGGYGSLDAVARLFEHRGLLLAGWVHYLAFDLLVGLWLRDEAVRLGLSRWLLVPCLLLTFLFGPLGWLLFLGVRWLRQHGGAVARAA